MVCRKKGSAGNHVSAAVNRMRFLVDTMLYFKASYIIIKMMDDNNQSQADTEDNTDGVGRKSEPEFNECDP